MAQRRRHHGRGGVVCGPLLLLSQQWSDPLSSSPSPSGPGAAYSGGGERSGCGVDARLGEPGSKPSLRGLPSNRVPPAPAMAAWGRRGGGAGPGGGRGWAGLGQARAAGETRPPAVLSPYPCGGGLGSLNGPSPDEQTAALCEASRCASPRTLPAFTL